MVAAKGVGNDDITITNATIMYSLSLHFGAGSNIFNIDGLNVFGGTSIGGGIDVDQVNIDHSTFNGAVSISTSSGNDTVFIGNTSGTPNTFFHSALTINVGLGTDQINLGSTMPIRVSGAATFVGDAMDTLTDSINNVYLSTRTKIGIP